jgi:hypothetical protein
MPLMPAAALLPSRLVVGRIAVAVEPAAPGRTGRKPCSDLRTSISGVMPQPRLARKARGALPQTAVTVRRSGVAGLRVGRAPRLQTSCKRVGLPVQTSCKPPTAETTRNRTNDPRRSREPSGRFASVRQPLQITSYIGAIGSKSRTSQCLRAFFHADSPRIPLLGSLPVPLIPLSGVTFGAPAAPHLVDRLLLGPTCEKR